MTGKNSVKFILVMGLLFSGILLAPSLWMILPALALTWFLVPGTENRRGYLAWGKGLFLTGVIYLVLMESAILLFVVTTRTSTGEPPGGDVVLIPGAAVIGDEPGAMLRARLEGALPILLGDPALPVIVSGARSAEDDLSEARVMTDWLTARGISPDRIYQEDQATDTIGNLEYTRAVIQRESLADQVILVTNDFHGFRAQAIARANGLKPRLVSVATPPLTLLRYLIRELASLVKVQLHYGLGLSWQG